MELRKDYILDRFVLVAEGRGKRPSEFKKELVEAEGSVCYFCPGNENLTPPEKGRMGNPWKIRWFNNKFGAVEEKGDPQIRTDNRYFTFSDAYGVHEVITETNDHKKQFHDLEDFELKDLFKVYKNRIDELSKKQNIKYVFIFKNSGKEAGTSLKHSHTQVMALNHVPHLVMEEINAVKTSLEKHPHCPYCDIINIEKGSFRKCFENNSFVAFTPYASRFNYEIWVFPKKHYLSITELDDWEFLELAQILKKIFSKLNEINAPYNFFIHNSPEQQSNNLELRNLHFHIEITPRLNNWAGFEIGSETYINTVIPELAAKFYRGELQ